MPASYTPVALGFRRSAAPAAVVTECSIGAEVAHLLTALGRVMACASCVVDDQAVCRFRRGSVPRVGVDTRSADPGASRKLSGASQISRARSPSTVMCMVGENVPPNLPWRSVLLGDGSRTPDAPMP